MDRLPDEYSVRELSEALGVDRTTVNFWLNRGYVPGQRVGRNWRIISEELRVQCPDIWQYLMDKFC